MTARLPKGTWLHRDAPSACDPASWCLVPTGDALLTRRARACDVYGHVLTRGYGRATSAPFAGLVRHADLAAQLSKGSPANVKDVAERLPRIGGIDRAGIAVTASWVLAAEIVNQLVLTTASWVAGGVRAVESGAPDVDAVARRTPVFAALAEAGRKVTPTDLEVWDCHALVAGVGTVVLAIRAGYTAREITPELLTDTATLSVAAALNQIAA